MVNKCIEDYIEHSNTCIYFWEQINEHDKTETNNDETSNKTTEEMEIEEPDIRVLVDNKKKGFKRISPQHEPKDVRAFECKICKEMFWTNGRLKEHMMFKHVDDGDWNCKECPFQSNNEVYLKKHIDAKHTPKSVIYSDQTLKCKHCLVQFKNKTVLNIHIKENHKSYKPCDNFSVDRCEFDSDCKFYHIKLKQSEVICYKCGDTFSSRTSLIKHIKQIHGNLQCVKYNSNECKFNSDTCFYSHTNKSNEPKKTVEKSTNVKNSESSEDFRHAPANLEPPDEPQSKETLEQHRLREIVLSEIPKMVEIMIPIIKEQMKIPTTN